MGIAYSQLNPGNHTVAVIKGKESYELLQEPCARRLFTEANKIVREGFREVDWKQIEIEMYLGGDYKVAEYK